jgi:hypothetical protein
MKQLLIKKGWCGLLGVITLLTAAIPDVHAGQRGLFVGRYYYRAEDPAKSQQRARDSKMNNIFLFTMEVETDGTLTFNTKDTRFPIARNGAYVGDASWPAFLSGCKGGSVQRIEICLAQWGSATFANIRNLVNSQGTGTSSILYRNFRVLKDRLPIDGIQFDDETTYDRTTMVRFGKMLKDSCGLWVSLCPYNNQTFWKNVKSDLGSRVWGVWLQCYDGGAGNDPAQWKSAMGNSSIIFPGLFYAIGATQMEAKARTWYSQGIRGGFVLGDVIYPESKWGQAYINAGW